tara:strand:+ start:6769 stop:6972 length:204 start_codon:yes stop_codon:yes gene_type:complete
MSNFTEKHNKLAVHLQELYRKHRKLDDEIQDLYKSFEKEEIVNRLKTKKLWLKDEIYRIERELKALG